MCRRVRLLAAHVDIRIKHYLRGLRNYIGDGRVTKRIPRAVRRNCGIWETIGRSTIRSTIDTSVVGAIHG